MLGMKRKISRRKALQLFAGGLGGALCAASGWDAALLEPYQVEVVRQPIELPELGSGWRGKRLAQISDLHFGGFYTLAQAGSVLEQLQVLKPDMVLMTGDYLTRGGDISQALSDLQEFLPELSKSYPVYAVRGNHDYGAERQDLQNVFRQSRVNLLDNRWEALSFGGDELILAGSGSLLAQWDGVRELAQSLPPNKPAFLLIHEPDGADYSAYLGKFSLQLSGHSHGGQVRLPLLGALLLPELGRRYPLGLYRVGGMWLYTNRGLGTTTLPLRFRCLPEITLFELI